MDFLPNLLPFVAHEVFADLCSALPPLDDTPEALDTRDRLAMVAIAGLPPINVLEALSAAEIVAAQAHVMDAAVNPQRAARIRLVGGLTPAAMAEFGAGRRPG